MVLDQWTYDVSCDKPKKKPMHATGFGPRAQIPAWSRWVWRLHVQPRKRAGAEKLHRNGAASGDRSTFPRKLQSCLAGAEQFLRKVGMLGRLAGVIVRAVGQVWGVWKSLDGPLGVAEDPGVSLVEQQTQQRDVVAAEAAGLLPDIAVAEQTGDGKGVPKSGSGSLSPDADLDQAAADFVDGFAWHGLDPCTSNRVEFHSKVGELSAPVGGNAAVVGQSRGQHLAQLDQVRYIGRSQQLRDAPGASVAAVDVDEPARPAAPLSAESPDR